MAKHPHNIASLSLNKILNYSGIPIENRLKEARYYYYGKLPGFLELINADSLLASRYFDLTTQSADYQAQFIIDRYQLPFPYSPDDKWWQKLHDQTDRWLQRPPRHISHFNLKDLKW